MQFQVKRNCWLGGVQAPSTLLNAQNRQKGNQCDFLAAILGGCKRRGAICFDTSSVAEIWCGVFCFKDTPSWLQKLLSFRYQKPNQIPIEGTVSNPEFEPNQISATRNQSRMRTGQASILVKVIKMSKYWRKTSKNKGSGVNLGCPCQGQYDYLLVRAI